jgi:hypothetical protein
MIGAVDTAGFSKMSHSAPSGWSYEYAPASRRDLPVVENRFTAPDCTLHHTAKA